VVFHGEVAPGWRAAVRLVAAWRGPAAGEDEQFDLPTPQPCRTAASDVAAAQPH
jgi:hypothetical protein